jgi:hypothetical protein
MMERPLSNSQHRRLGDALRRCPLSLWGLCTINHRFQRIFVQVGILHKKC